MMIYVNLAIALFGLVMYLVCQPKPTSFRAAEAGRIMFFVGLLAFLLTVVGSKSLPAILR